MIHPRPYVLGFTICHQEDISGDRSYAICPLCPIDFVSSNLPSTRNHPMVTLPLAIIQNYLSIFLFVIVIVSFDCLLLRQGKGIYRPVYAKHFSMYSQSHFSGPLLTFRFRWSMIQSCMQQSGNTTAESAHFCDLVWTSC